MIMTWDARTPFDGNASGTSMTSMICRAPGWSAPAKPVRLLVCLTVVVLTIGCGRSTASRGALQDQVADTPLAPPVAMRIKYELRDLDHQAVTAGAWPTELAAPRVNEVVFDARGNWKLSSLTTPPPQYEDVNIDVLEYVDGMKYYFVNGEVSEVIDTESMVGIASHSDGGQVRIVPHPPLNPRGAAAIAERDLGSGGRRLVSEIVSHGVKTGDGLPPTGRREVYEVPKEAPPGATASVSAVLPWKESGNVETHEIVFDEATPVIYLYRESLNGIPINEFRVVEAELLPPDHEIEFHGPAAAAEAGLSPEGSD